MSDLHICYLIFCNVLQFINTWWRFADWNDKSSKDTGNRAWFLIQPYQSTLAISVRTLKSSPGHKTNRLQKTDVSHLILNEDQFTNSILSADSL